MNHIDFALNSNEIEVCVLCGKAPTPSSWSGSLWYDGGMTVVPGGRYPIGGLVGVCSSCGYRSQKRDILAKWRQTAPRFIQIFPGTAIRLVARECCDDASLAQVIRETFEAIPVSSRRKIMEYVTTSDDYSVTGKGMRFEALGRWPSMGDCLAMNMDYGHAIRFRASYVKSALDDRRNLVGTIAHELAHTEQCADNKYFDFSDDCEKDVEERLRAWGFEPGVTEDIKQQLLSEVDLILKFASVAKDEITAQRTLPSGNFAAAALSEATRATNAVMRLSDRWRGR